MSAWLCSQDAARLKGIQSWLVMFVCCGILFSWFAAIKYHGVLPVAAKNHIWVANHTSMIDYAVVCAATPFASVMQYHPGWMGWIQEHIMGCIDCVFFNRGKVRPLPLFSVLCVCVCVCVCVGVAVTPVSLCQCVCACARRPWLPVSVASSSAPSQSAK